MNRVQIPAYTDRWMMGDRYGDAVAYRTRKGEQHVKVRLDVSGKTFWFKTYDCTFY